MDEIIARARELGKQIAAHPRTAAFMTAARAVAEDREAQKILSSYQDQAERMRELEEAGKPIEPADKKKLAEYEAGVVSHAKLKEMMKHQADYLEMMNRINHAIDESIQADE